MEKIISVIFKVESEGYQALSELRKAPVADAYTVSQAVLVRKENNGVKVLDGFDTGAETMDDTAVGGLVGSILGIVGGPLGVLLGGSIGMLTGSILDKDDAVHNASLIEMVSEQLVDGEVVLIALEQETEAGALKKMFDKFDVSVVEDDAAEVAEEVKRAAEVEKEMARQAKEKLREEKKEEHKQKIEENRAKLAADFEAVKEKFKKD